MSTYYFVSLDVPVRVSDDEARAAIKEALSHIPHRLDTNSHYPPILAERLPIMTGDAPRAYPADGWIVENGHLNAEMFMENIYREIGAEIVDGVEVDDTRRRCEPLFAALARLADAKVGHIIGTLANENSECAGSLLLTDSGVRHAESTAWHPGRGYDAEPDFEPISAVPPGSITLDDDALTCTVDASIVIAELESRRIDGAVEFRKIGAS